MFNLLGVNIHLYGLLIGIGVWLAYELALARTKSISEKRKLEDAFLWILPSGVVGARIYHVIDYWTRYYSQNPMKILFVWEGGLGIWGAIVGGTLAAYIYCRINKLNFLGLMDDVIVGVPLAQAIGRLGNWVNGELVGKNGEPLFAYEAVLNLVLFSILWKISRKKTSVGKLTGLYLIGYGMIRTFLEGMRPEEIVWKVGGIPTAVIFGAVAVISGTWIATARLRDSQ